jgi:hypothetical protein
VGLELKTTAPEATLIGGAARLGAKNQHVCACPATAGAALALLGNIDLAHCFSGEVA